MPFIATPMKPNQPDNPSHPNWSTIASLILFFHFNALINYLIRKPYQLNLFQQINVMKLHLSTRRGNILAFQSNLSRTDSLSDHIAATRSMSTFSPANSKDLEEVI